MKLMLGRACPRCGGQLVVEDEGARCFQCARTFLRGGPEPVTVLPSVQEITPGPAPDIAKREAALEVVRACPQITSSEVAARLGIARQTAHSRLSSLAAMGLVERQVEECGPTPRTRWVAA